jgi:hypothetical protein
METGGWKTRQMFDRYAIVSNADQRAAMEKLERSQTEFSHDSTFPAQSGTEITNVEVN